MLLPNLLQKRHKPKQMQRKQLLQRAWLLRSDPSRYF